MSLVGTASCSANVHEDVINKWNKKGTNEPRLPVGFIINVTYKNIVAQVPAAEREVTVLCCSAISPSPTDIMLVLYSFVYK